MTNAAMELSSEFVENGHFTANVTPMTTPVLAKYKSLCEDDSSAESAVVEDLKDKMRLLRKVQWKCFWLPKYVVL